MPFNLLEAEIYVQTPIDIVYEGGVFHVTDYYGGSCVIRRAIPPHIYLANLKRAQVALAAWCAEQRRNGVVPFVPEARKLG
jgi:hypothetical protein